MSWLKSLLAYVFFLLFIFHVVDFYRLYQRDDHHVPDDVFKQIVKTLSIKQQQDFIDGQPLLLYVWASWCGVCSATSSAVDRISEDYPVMTIALQSGTQDSVRSFMQQHDYDFMVLNDNSGILARALEVQATPSFFIIDNQGDILYHSVGINTEPSLRAKLFLFH